MCIDTTTFFFSLKFTELIQSDWAQKASTVKDAQIRMAREMGRTTVYVSFF